MNDADGAGGTSATGDANFKYGSVEVCLIGFAGERPGTEVVDAILDLVQAGSVRLLDLLFVSRSRDGDLRVLEREEIADAYGLAGLEVVELGRRIGCGGLLRAAATTAAIFRNRYRGLLKNPVPPSGKSATSRRSAGLRTTAVANGCCRSTRGHAPAGNSLSR
ncbi:DUF6325 family protein [Arthrobacter glacialis]|uniref:DUF6325 family protein n=1 Tax=Arthrobacter glacialis TaxID=1664 RepID=UPI001FB045AD|nr:DUF6325 family protein [Arthrobacter glacialis]